MSKLIENKKLMLFMENSVQIPLLNCFQLTENISEADIVITNKISKGDKLILVPTNLFIGIGLHEWITEEEIERGIKEALNRNGFEFKAVQAIATIDKKSTYPALLSFVKIWIKTL